MKSRITVLLINIIITGSLYAQTTTWTGAVDSNWGNAGNWDNGIPGTGDLAVFDNGTTANCTLDATRTIGAIQINGYVGSINLNGFNLSVGALATANQFNSGSIDGSGTVFITSTQSATFDGTDFGSNANVTATLTTNTGVFTGGSLTTFGGFVTVTASRILLNGSTYNKITQLTKTGNLNDFSAGGNIFNEATSITNSSSNTLRSGTTSPDEFNGGILLNLEGTSSGTKIQMAYSTTGNKLNDQLAIRSLSTGVADSEISFGAGGGATTIADGVTISEHADEFLKGDFWLNNVTQSSNTPAAITLDLTLASASGSQMRLKISDCEFYGNVDFTASNLYVSGSSFHGASNVFMKARNGCLCPLPQTQNTWEGGNTFYNSTRINLEAGVTLVLARLNPDSFEGDVTFWSNFSNSNFRIAETGTNSFKGDITFLHNSTGASRLFGQGGGTALFNGSTTQTITATGATPTFARLQMSNTGGLDLNTRINVTTALTMTSGNIITSATNYISMADNCVAGSGSDASFIEGPARKTGDDAFTFPLGAGGLYHPLGISAPASTTSEFEAEYFATASGHGTNADGTINKVSTHEYWTLNQLTGSDNVFVTLGWVSPFANTSDYIVTPANLRVLRWDGVATWNDMGNGTVVDNGGSGTVSTAAAIGTFGDFTLGSTTVDNKLPIELTSFIASKLDDRTELSWETASELNNDHFEIERSSDARFFSVVGKVQGHGTTNQNHSYKWTDQNPIQGWNYYRLRQFDFDGSESKSKIVQVFVEKTPYLYPNPVTDILFLDQIGYDENTEVVISSLIGKVYHAGRTQPSISVSDMPPGLYLLIVSTNGATRSFRFNKR